MVYLTVASASKKIHVLSNLEGLHGVMLTFTVHTFMCTHGFVHVYCKTYTLNIHLYHNIIGLKYELMVVSL